MVFLTTPDPTVGTAHISDITMLTIGVNTLTATISVETATIVNMIMNSIVDVQPLSPVIPDFSVQACTQII